MDEAAQLEARANELEAWLKQQSSFYIQYEDMGYTAARIRVLRETARGLRDRAVADPSLHTLHT